MRHASVTTARLARRLLMASGKLPHRRQYLRRDGIKIDITPLPRWFNLAWRFVDWLSK